MFHVTDTALERLAKALDRIDDEEAPGGSCFRIVSQQEDGKLALTVDAPKAADATYQHDGETVLVVSDELQDLCDDRTLDSDATGNLVLI